MQKCEKALSLRAGVSVLIVNCGAWFAWSAEQEPDVDFVRDVKPILVRHCYECHDAEQAESGLQLDELNAAFSGGDHGAAIVPGQSSESLLYQVVAGEGDVAAMPFERPRLAAEEVSLIRHWIDQGAKAPETEFKTDHQRRASDHWAFQPIRRASIPKVRQESVEQIRNPIDAFLLARLESEGIEPSPEADRLTLIRRLSLDLRGLPPSIEEVDVYLNDDRPDAYERLVDRLLASPNYGERWARHWLDIARYADSNGFTIDGPRSIWKYRDWVIEAFNADKPFNEFVIEQLAGDLIPDATVDQLVATGFHRNTLVNEEGGTDKEQFRVEAVVDRVNTTGTAFLGLSVGCAQCHQHKYDPITQKEFYQLFAFFNNTEDVNTITPEIPLPTPAQATLQDELRAAIAAAENELKDYDSQIAAGQAEWERAIAEKPEQHWTVLKPVQFVSEAGAMIDKLSDESLIVGGNGNIPSNDVYVVQGDVELPRITAMRLELLTSPGLPKNGPGLSETGNFVLTELKAEATPRHAGELSSEAIYPIEWASCTADWSQRGFPAEQSIDGNPRTGWSIDVNAADGPLNVDREIIFIPREPMRHSEGARLTLRIEQQHADVKHLLGRFRFSVTADELGEKVVPVSIHTAVQQESDSRTPEQQAMLKAAFVSTDRNRRPLADRVNDLTRQLKELTQSIPTTLVLRELDPPRESFVMIRGDFLRPGARVSPDVLSVLPPLPKGIKTPNRLDLARWLVSPDHPLTARVTVNRQWQHFFGLGLVETENDFGTQGNRPSHPELLDWLASEFQRLEWSPKRLHRLIVTSAAYRRSSAVREDLMERDPVNKLLARQSRLRLEAETVRDVWLAAGGLLSEKIGGPGVYPPQPGGIALLTQVSKAWPESQGEARYRRGMYTYFWRSNPYPFLPTFDAPNATSACTRRNRSNTPLQALTLANDRSFMEIVGGLAARILQNGPNDDGERMQYAFRVCLSRAPNAYEQQRLMTFLRRQRELFEQDTREARKVIGDELSLVTTPSEAAAWTAVARVLLNLDEFVTRE